MIDSYGRGIDYVRISLTDRCNLRCSYCIPEEDCEFLNSSELMTDDQILLLCNVLAECGVKKIKLTGGEPLLRKSTPFLIQQIKNITGITQVTLTTNGVLLKEKLPQLIEAGLDGVNISIDHLDEETYKNITKRDELRRVLEGLEAASQVAHLNVKINCVPLHLSKEDLLALCEIARHKNIHVRFIEVMPIGHGKHSSSMTEEEMKQILTAEYGTLIPYQKSLGNGPSHYYQIPGFLGKIGFISAISHKFCDSCNRVRVTADGILKTCLQYEGGNYLRPYLCEERKEELKQVILSALDKKPKGHRFHEKKDGKEESRRMSSIGG